MRKFCLASIFIILCSTVSVYAEETKKFTAERVFDLEYAYDPQISPNGRTIIYARRSANRVADRMINELWSLDVNTGAHRPLITGKGSIASARWSPNGDRIVYLGAENGKMQLSIMYLDTGQSFTIAQLDQSPSAPAWSPDGKYIAFSMFKPAETPSFAKAPSQPEGGDWAKPVRVFDDIVFRSDGAGYLKEGATHIYIVSADGGAPRQLTDGPNEFTSPAWLDDSTLLAVSNDVDDAYLDPIESEIYAIDIATRERNALTQRDGPDNSPVVSPNGRQIAFLGYDDKVKSYQQTDVYVMNRNGSNVKNLTANFDHSVSSVAWRNNSLVIQAGVNGNIHIASLNMNGGVDTLVTDAGGATIARPYGAASFSVAARTGAIAYTSGNALKPADVSVLQGGRARVLTALNDDVLPHLDLAPIEEIKVSSSHDGREIEAWVALPPGFKADGSYPMILEIHGGPFSMYGPFFSAEIQRFAAEGYVTVYSNPRGSTGYGEEFAQLIDQAYPSQDYDDLISVVDSLIERNYVDPNRLFVTGGSGGGVLTAWIVGKTDRFAAAASIKPVINWLSMALTSDIAQYVIRHWIRESPWENPEAYWKTSPLSLVGNVTTPTLVMVGEEDWRTPAWESEQFYTALKLQKIDTALIRVPGAPHFIANRPSQLIAKTDNIMGWFAKYDPANMADNAADE